MATNRHPLWRPLPASGRGVPNLLVSASFSVSPVSYSLHITDMAHVWAESLDDKSILRRALQERTSIDPLDDHENYKELLRWIGGAFNPESSVYVDTSITISAAAESQSNESDDTPDDLKLAPGDLKLLVTCILPSPLKPMKWPMRLKLCPPSKVATEVVLPLVQAQHERVREVDALLAVIREKDSVIARVVDKLESIGVTLDQVFTSLAIAGRKKVTKQIAEARISGLAPFKEGEFRARHEKGTEGDAEGADDGAAQPKDVKGLIQRVFANSELPRSSGLEFGDSPALDEWWKNISPGSGGKSLTVDRKRKTAPDAPDQSNLRKATPDPKPDSPDEDDFEVRATPPRQKSPPPPEADDGSTASEVGDDFEIPDSFPPPQKTQKSAAAATTKPKRMGAIGKKKQPDPEPEPEADTESEPEKSADIPMKDADVGSATASSPASAAAGEASPSPPKAPSGKRIGGMGRISAASRAAKAAAEEQQQPQSSNTMDEEDTAVVPAPAGKKRIGRIGKKAAASTAVDRNTPAGAATDSGGEEAATMSGRAAADNKAKKEEEEEDSEGGADSKKSRKKAVAPRETSTERAARRKEELRKEMEKKSTAGPAKKKRKF